MFTEFENTHLAELEEPWNLQAKVSGTKICYTSFQMKLFIQDIKFISPCQSSSTIYNLLEVCTGSLISHCHYELCSSLHVHAPVHKGHPELTSIQCSTWQEPCLLLTPTPSRFNGEPYHASVGANVLWAGPNRNQSPIQQPKFDAHI